jgi:hypothetical protein
MRLRKIALLGLGSLMVLSGAVWAAQGAGYFPYPASSFMISRTPWIWYGGLMVLAGLAVIFAARKN